MTSFRHFPKLFILGLTGTISFGASLVAAEPIWDAKGNYAPPDQSPAYLSWRVVDPDPNGLNCRIANQYRSVRFELQKPGSPAIADNKHDIANWPVLVKVPTKTLMTAPLMDFRGGKLQVAVRDVSGRPWLPLKTYLGQCLVRGNSRYIQPVPASWQPLPKG